MTSTSEAAVRPGARAARVDAAGLAVEWWGRVPYAEALARQERAVRQRIAGRGGDRLFLLEHPPVITLGRRADPRHVLVDPAELARRGVEVHRVSRGGDVTWHGPGQLVGYLVADLAAGGPPDLHAFLRDVEGALIDALRDLGLSARRVPGWTGVFVDRARHPRTDGPERKLASIGVGVRRWVSFHGFALNVDPELAGFASIVPCGLHGVEMTSIARELGALDPAAVRARVAEAFRARFGGARAAVR